MKRKRSTSLCISICLLAGMGDLDPASEDPRLEYAHALGQPAVHRGDGRRMEESVAAYERLAALTDRTYVFGYDLGATHWKTQGLREFQQDL